MWLLLILMYPFAEVYVFYRFIDAYSFLDALMWVMTSAALGILILLTQGRSAFAGLQESLRQGQPPSPQILHRVLILFGGLMFLIPGIISDVIGALCVLPISRHAIVWYMKKTLLQAVAKGRVGIFVSGFPSHRPERDATVVDVTPIAVIHENKND